MRDDLRPPSNQALGLRPEALPGPLSIQDKNCVACPADSFAFGAVLFLKTIYGNDIPRPIMRKLAYPCEVGRVAGETIGKVYDFFDFWLDS